MKLHYHFELNPEKWKNNTQLVIVSIDLEWAKNWKAIEKTVPFCFALHVIYVPKVVYNSALCPCINAFKMTADVLWRSPEETTTAFLLRINKLIGAQFDHKNTVVVGHQISSDLHCMLQHSAETLSHIKKIAEQFTKRKNRRGKVSSGQSLFPSLSQSAPATSIWDDKFNVFDTRYDIRSKIKGQERLRDVSLRLGVYAIQFELSPVLSLTRLYNLYLQDQDPRKKERLIILNWRHAFQTALVYLIDQVCPSLKCSLSLGKRDSLTTNDIIYKMASGSIAYVDSEEYRYSMSEEGINRYLGLYKNPG
jgi:hypothetical protein